MLLFGIAVLIYAIVFKVWPVAIASGGIVLIFLPQVIARAWSKEPTAFLPKLSTPQQLLVGLAGIAAFAALQWTRNGWDLLSLLSFLVSAFLLIALVAWRRGWWRIRP